MVAAVMMRLSFYQPTDDLPVISRIITEKCSLTTDYWWTGEMVGSLIRSELQSELESSRNHLVMRLTRLHDTRQTLKCFLNAKYFLHAKYFLLRRDSS